MTRVAEQSQLPAYFTEPKIVPVGEFLPDQAAFGNPGSTIALNVLPRSQGSYGPLGALLKLGYTALPSQPFGFYSYLDNAGAIDLFAGTADKLFKLSTGGTGFADVTQPATTYTAGPDDPWAMVSFGNSIIATTGTNPMQVFTIGNPNFTDLSVSAPLAKYIAVVKNFLVCANTTEGGISFPQRIHWSGIGNPSVFPPLGSIAAAATESDAQDLRSDLGFCRGIAANLQAADMVIFMDSGIYSGSYVGSPVIFNFQVIQGANGCRFPNSIVSHHGLAYYIATDGFYSLDGANAPTPIGAQKVDNWFFNDPTDGADPTYITRTQAVVSPNGHLICWAYCGPSSGGVFNRILFYNWQLNRWSFARVNSSWLARGLTIGYSLDQLDQFGDLDHLPFTLDSPFWTGGYPTLMAFDSSFVLSAFAGPNMAATVETTEIQPTPGRRSRVTSVRPLIDGGAAQIELGYRNDAADPVTYTSAKSMNLYGEVPTRIDTRYVRAQISLAAGQVWTHCQGAEVSFAESTRR